ncbi:MAG TPA: acyl-CoA dehydrogenase family protein [Marmoricola sp.]|nr:acyl-CoA dehydrogenase family protein [Marmoricola sp.]
MDFTFSEEAREAATLAADVLAGYTSNEQLRAVEQTGDRHDRQLWAALGEAGLLGLGVPESHGGAGLGLLELGRVAAEAGRRVAPVALVDHLAAAYVLAEVAPTSALLESATTGAAQLSVAIAEPLHALPERPEVTAQDGRLTGFKTLVRAADRAAALLVTADDGLYLVHPEEVTRQAQHTGDGEQVWLVEFAQTPATRLGGADARDRLVDVVVALRCAEQVGRLQGAQRLTAAYARTREQFGRPIGTFQAVSQRLADGYIDTLGADLTVWSALWRLEVGLPASAEVAIAALWAADAGHRVAHTTVHVHGGVGIDLDGEAHRYFTALKRGEFDLGGATLQARRIGALLAG